MKRYLKLLIPCIIAIIILTLIYSYVNQNKYETYHTVLKELEQKGFTATAENSEKDILFGERKWVKLNSVEHIAIYIYEDQSSMEADAECIGENGSPYKTSSTTQFISWVSSPHFYKQSNIIALYVGDDPKIIHSLEAIFGMQFAGQS